MKPKFFGDSYDIVKQSFIRWLASTGPWSTHPMFTEYVSSERADWFGRLLGTRILSREVFNTSVDRDIYLAPARDCREHVFLDPDTGIRLKPTRGKTSPKYIFDTELVAIANARQGRLTLVFDQSLARGKECQQMKHKLSKLAERCVYGVAYVSHACFVLVGTDQSSVESALETIKRESGLPEPRFLIVDRRGVN